MGAHTALLTAGARPDLVARLTLLECHPGGDAPDTARLLGEYFASWPVPFPTVEAARAFFDGHELTETWIADLAHTPEGLVPRFASDTMEATMVGLQEPRWPEWEGLAVPTLAVFAEHGLFTDCQKQELIDRRPVTRRADLRDVPHDAHLDPRGRWIPVLEEWLTRPL
jgi:pimeloyl-ACP methyl ester carboxylesterase